MRDAAARVRERTVEHAWPLLQAATAATVAWVVAKHGFEHEQPFFAPIAALVALNTIVGERGRNAFRLLQGVLVGILIGELALAALGSSWWSLGLATFAAAAAGRALANDRLVIAQAAAGAILVLAIADTDAGIDRLLDALIGAGVALVFSQLLFAPEPVRLLRRAETAALRDFAAGLDLTAQGLERDDDALVAAGVTALRSSRDRLTDLARVRRASASVTRSTLVWRSRRAPTVEENENAEHLDLLGGSCVLIARTAVPLATEERRALAPAARDLTRILAELATTLDERASRQRAADRALDLAAGIHSGAVQLDTPVAAAQIAVRLAATDVMVFAGVDADEADAAVRAGILERRIAEPPREVGGLFARVRRPFRRLRRLFDRGRRRR